MTDVNESLAALAYTVRAIAADTVTYTPDCAKADTIIVDMAHEAKFDKFFDRGDPANAVNQLAMLGRCTGANGTAYDDVVQLIGYLLARGVNLDDIIKEITMPKIAMPKQWNVEDPRCRLRHLRLVLRARGFTVKDSTGRLIATVEPAIRKAKPNAALVSATS